MIPYAKRKKVYEAEIDNLGIRETVLTSLEELSFLEIDITQNLRGVQNHDLLAMQIAMVTTFLERLRLIYGVNDAVNDWIDELVSNRAEKLEVDLE